MLEDNIESDWCFDIDTATAKGNREIAQYRWFIDQRLVAETDQPHYLWDLRGEHPGQHWITVHAVDGGFNRAATQIPVRIAATEP